ncbi:MAG: CoA pyrophosphatase [Trichlorobacter sp.]|jgi:8-oxo-dGTP pyrophosphatase MutT (NUDIX family)|nr:CoA pyrophosphatase [Trichlorobacter sp.]
MKKFDFNEIQLRLNRVKPVLCPENNRKPAAVALILQQNGAGVELFFVQRAEYPDDPWSGDIAFPGGGFESVDCSLRATAERETKEEVGLDLSAAAFLGRLSDIMGRSLPVRVSCFVYGLHKVAKPALSEEIKEAFWVPFDYLTAAQRQTSKTICFNGRTMQVPATWLYPDKPVLWGITYRLVNQFRYLLLDDVEPPDVYDLPL